MCRRSQLFALVVILAGLVHLFCLAYISRHPRAMFTLDSAEYIWAGHNLSRAGVLYAGDLSRPLNPVLYSRRPPVYPLLILAAWKCWEDVRGVVLIQIGLSLTSGWLLWMVLGFLKLGPGIRLATAAVFLFYPAQIIYTQILMPEILLQFFVLLAVLALGLFLRTGAAGWLWMLNAALTLAVMTKPVLMFFWLPNLLFLVWVAARSRRATLVLAGLLPLFVQSAWSYRNERLTGSFHFSSMSAQIQRYLVNHYRYRDESDRAYPAGEPGSPKALSGDESFPSLLRVAIEHPLDMTRRQLIGMAAFFLDPGRFDFLQFSGSPYSYPGFSRIHGWDEFLETSRGAGGLLYVLTAVGLLNLAIGVGFLLFPFRPVQAEMKLFVCLVVIYVAVATAAYGRSRYRLPVMPEMFLAAAVAVDRRRGEPGNELPPGWRR